MMNKIMNGWLVIWRKKRESILIGREIEISVSKIEGDQVWIAIKAPWNVKVRRKEVAELNKMDH